MALSTATGKHIRPDIKPPSAGKVDSSKNGAGQCPRRAVKFETVAISMMCKPEAAALRNALLFSLYHSLDFALSRYCDGAVVL